MPSTGRSAIDASRSCSSGLPRERRRGHKGRMRSLAVGVWMCVAGCGGDLSVELLAARDGGVVEDAGVAADGGAAGDARVVYVEPLCRACSPPSEQNPEPCDGPKNFCSVDRTGATVCGI